MNEKQQQTDELTGGLEAGVRRVIDAKFEVASFEKALRDLETNVASNRGAIAPTQSTLGASQFRRRRDGDGDSEVDDDENGGAVEFLKRKVSEQISSYQSESMALR